MQKLIGLYSSAPQSGKSEVARFLVERYGYTVVPFAQTLKEALIPVLVALGYTDGQAKHLVTKAKATELPDIKLSVRQLLQTLGTEWGRQCVHPNLWLMCWQKRISQYDLVVVDDVRFENEAELVRSLGGELWKVERPGTTQVHGHISEGSLDTYEGFSTILNNRGSLEELRLTVEGVAAA